MKKIILLMVLALGSQAAEEKKPEPSKMALTELEQTKLENIKLKAQNLQAQVQMLQAQLEKMQTQLEKEKE